MDIACEIILVLFGIFAGFFIGVGNRRGLLVALVAGALTGALLDVPFFRDGDRLSCLMLFGSAIVGSVIAAFTPDGNALKQRIRRQRGLRISCGNYYQLGGK